MIAKRKKIPNRDSFLTLGETISGIEAFIKTRPMALGFFCNGSGVFRDGFSVRLPCR